MTNRKEVCLYMGSTDLISHNKYVWEEERKLMRINGKKILGEVGKGSRK